MCRTLHVEELRMLPALQKLSNQTVFSRLRPLAARLQARTVHTGHSASKRSTLHMPRTNKYPLFVCLGDGFPRRQNTKFPPPAAAAWTGLGPFIVHLLPHDNPMISQDWQVAGKYLQAVFQWLYKERPPEKKITAEEKQGSLGSPQGTPTFPPARALYLEAGNL